MDNVKVRLVTLHLAIIALFIPLLLSSCSDDGGAQEQAGQRSAESHVTNARSYLKQGQYRAAVLEAKNALQKAPSADSVNLLVDVYIELGHYKSARSILESHVEKYPELKIRLAEAYLHLQKFYSAEDVLKSITKNEANKKQYDLFTARTKMGLGKQREAFSALGGLAQQFPDDKDVRVAQFLSVFKSGTPDESEQTLSKLLTDFSEDPEVLLTASKVRFLQKNYPDTEKHLMNALHLTPQTDVLNPLRSGILHMLSKTLTQQGRYTEAAPYSKILKEANPQAEDVQKRLDEAFAALKSGKINVGEELLAKLRQEFPNMSTTDALLGLINLEQGNLGKASEFFENSVDPEVAAPNLSAAAAITKLRLDERVKAIEILETAIRSNPESLQLQVLYGLATIGDPGYSDKASLALEKAISLGTSDYRVYSLLANKYVESDKNKAIAVLNKASQTFSNVEDQLKLYNSYVALGFNSQAANYVKQVKKNQAKSEAGWLMQAVSEINKKDFKAAKSTLTKAVKVNSKSDKAWFLLGNSNLVLGDLEASSKAFKKAIVINPSVGHYLRGLYLAEAKRQKDFAAIEASMLEVAKNEQLKASIHGYLAQRAMTEQKFSESKAFIEKFKGSTESTPGRIEVLETQIAVAQAMFEVKQSNVDAAIELLEKALSSYAQSEELLVRVGNLYLEKEDWGKAEKVKLALQKLGGKSLVLATLFEADIYDKKGEYQSAMDVLKSHWIAAKNNRLGNAIFGLGSRRDIKLEPQFFSEWREAQPANPNPLVLEAMYVQPSNQEKSVSLYEKALQLDGNLPTVLNNLAWIYQEKNQLKKADELASRALALTPESPSVLDTAGIIKMKMGDKKAIALLEKARSLAPSSPEIEEHYQQAKRSL